MEWAVASASSRDLGSASFLIWSVACWFWALTWSRRSSDGYYWDHAANRLGFVLREGRKGRD